MHTFGYTADEHVNDLLKNPDIHQSHRKTRGSIAHFLQWFLNLEMAL